MISAVFWIIGPNLHEKKQSNVKWLIQWNIYDKSNAHKPYNVSSNFSDKNIITHLCIENQPTLMIQGM